MRAMRLVMGSRSWRRVQRSLSSSAVFQVTARDFQERVVKNPRPVVVDFYADWCGTRVPRSPATLPAAGVIRASS